MKTILFFILLPIFSYSQTNKEEQKKKLQKIMAIADTMHFSNPFILHYMGTSSLADAVIYKRAHEWLAVTNTPKDSIKPDSLHGKLEGYTNDPELGISFTTCIEVQNGKYDFSMKNFKNTTIPGSSKRVEDLGNGPDIKFAKYMFVMFGKTSFEFLTEYIKTGVLQVPRY